MDLLIPRNPLLLQEGAQEFEFRHREAMATGQGGRVGRVVDERQAHRG